MPPDAWFSPTVLGPPPDPATQVWPGRTRPELIVDNQRVMLADNAGFLVGFDTNWGRGGALARTVYANRAGTRDL